MRILLAVDGSKFSEAAIQAVLTQCVRLGTKVAVLHVAERSSVFGYPAGVSMKEEKLAPVLVKRVAERLRAAGFQVKMLVSEGDAAEEIIDTAADWGADLIVLGSHGKRGITRFLLGSVSATVALHAPCAVEVVRVPSGRRDSRSSSKSGLKTSGQPSKR
jgi:nucleotide-binding universal stress UspA family protein